MAFSSSFCSSLTSFKICHPGLVTEIQFPTRIGQRSTYALCNSKSKLPSQQIRRTETLINDNWSFLEGSRALLRTNPRRAVLCHKSARVYASLLPNPQLASSAFTLGTVAVLPFYTLMVVAPKAELTKKVMENGIPYIVLGVVYAYLLYLSWTPDTMKLMFASKYWLPELPGIAKMFSNEMTLASAWIHLLAVDLFAARQVYHDGLQDNIETRHSVSLCLLFCPVGILSHFITKSMSKSPNKTERMTN